MSKVYRKQLAEELKNSPNERNEILGEAKKDPQYWDAKIEHLKNDLEEEPTEDGMGVILKNRTLFHGSGTPGISEMLPADEITLGNGIYFTSKAVSAAEYARRRALSNERRFEMSGKIVGEPVVYIFKIDDAKFLDLRNEEAKSKFKILWLERLKQVLRSLGSENDELKKYAHEIKTTTGTYFRELTLAISRLEKGELVLAHEPFSHLNRLLTEFIQNSGYDGLISMEGGELGFKIREHDTYVLYNVEKSRMIGEQKII